MFPEGYLEGNPYNIYSANERYMACLFSLHVLYFVSQRSVDVVVSSSIDFCIFSLRASAVRIAVSVWVC